jgi:hypothetical protein
VLLAPPSTALKNHAPWTPEQDAPKKTVVAGRFRTVFITAQPEGPHFCGGLVLPRLVVVPVPAVVLLFELPPHAAIRRAIAVIAPNAARRHEIEDISKGSFSIGIRFAAYARFGRSSWEPARLGRATEVFSHVAVTVDRGSVSI